MLESKTCIEEKKSDESELWIMVYTLNSLMRKNIPLAMIVSKSLEYLKSFYFSNKNQEYIDMALLEIEAFLVIGGRYISNEKQFDEILMAADINKQKFLLKYGAKEVKLNRNQIRGLIRKWMPSKENPMKVSEVVEDILEKVTNQVAGKYVYSYTRHFGKQCEVDLYELVIETEFSYFHDVSRMQYYVLKK